MQSFIIFKDLSSVGLISESPTSYADIQRARQLKYKTKTIITTAKRGKQIKYKLKTIINQNTEVKKNAI